MFQNNAWSGMLMLIGIFLSSWQMGLLAVAGNVVSTLTALFSGYRREDIRNGLYGFNGTLVGIAVGVFMPLTLGAWLLLAVTACVSTYIAKAFSLQRVVPGFTAPFILAVWLLLGFCHLLMPDLLLPASGAVPAEAQVDYYQAFSVGIGQVMFQGTGVAGIFFLLGILHSSPKACGYAALGSLLSIPFALWLGAENAVLNMGLMGYNGALCAIALGGRTWQSGAWAIFSILLSVVLQMAGMELGLTTLTAPFVVSVWLTMGVQGLFRTFGAASR